MVINEERNGFINKAIIKKCIVIVEALFEVVDYKDLEFHRISHDVISMPYAIDLVGADLIFSN